MTTLPDLPAGVWRHWKGPLYLVLGYAHDANYEGRTVVVYVALELSGAHTGARLAVRTVEDFHAVVDPVTGATVEHWDGTEAHPVQRFAYVGPGWDGQR